MISSIVIRINLWFDDLGLTKKFLFILFAAALPTYLCFVHGVVPWYKALGFVYPLIFVMARVVYWRRWSRYGGEEITNSILLFVTSVSGLCPIIHLVGALIFPATFSPKFLMYSVGISLGAAILRTWLEPDTQRVREFKEEVATISMDLPDKR